MTDQEALYDFLNALGLLTPEEVDIIAKNTQLQWYKKGDYLLEEGDVAQFCHAVIKGCVREFYVVDGIEKTTGFFTEGMPVNSFTSAQTQKPSKHFIICNEDTLVTISDQDLEAQMCRLIPRLESIIRQEVEKGSGELQDRLAQILIQSPEQRVAQFVEEHPSLLGRVPQHQIASYLGITPESFSRIKKRIYSQPR